MKRRDLQSALSGQEQDPSVVWNWYEFQQEINGVERMRALASLGGNVPPLPHYFGLGRDEIDEHFRIQRAQLDRAAMFLMLSATEATLRVNSIQRVVDRKKDAVSIRFGEIYKRRKELKRVRLEEDVLNVWLNHGTVHGLNGAINRFKQALGLRHWLAHGHYWIAKLGQRYSPTSVFEICANLLRRIQ